MELNFSLHSLKRLSLSFTHSSMDSGLDHRLIFTQLLYEE